ncbi:MAG: saccharopine dehydrogenase [Flavobacteriales bacterium]|nr:saccharopine dehydrogenase [Flavobacteriales bacterium]|tara:strand:+ start:1233 stop:2438 length:1206 start_codon:yes stop_codon:yes gene_type:complete
MKNVLIIGAGGVSNVATKKIARLTDVFTDITLASRTKSKCDKIASEVHNVKINTAQIDADNVEELVGLINKSGAELVVNLALPYQDIPIMEACLQTKTHYLDTANYEPKDEAKYEYSWQWAYKRRFESAGIMALLGCGFDPGVTQVYTAYAAKKYFDEIYYLDIVDCNGGDHGKVFATNFNPEVNIREITQNGKFWENGAWKSTSPMEVHKSISYPNIGERESYLMYHEELESLVKNFPTLKRARFWMTFSKEYLIHLKVLENVGMTSISPIEYEGKLIQPLQFLKAVLPEPSELAKNYSGETSIGCQIAGVKNGKMQTCYIYNNCKHEDAFRDVKGQGVAYTTGVPAMLGSKLMATGEWFKPGVYNVEEMNPDPFMNQIGDYGLPWNIIVNEPLPVNQKD